MHCDNIGSLHLSFGNVERLPKHQMTSVMTDVTKMQNMKLCALDEGVFNLQMPTKSC